MDGCGLSFFCSSSSTEKRQDRAGTGRKVFLGEKGGGDRVDERMRRKRKEPAMKAMYAEKESEGERELLFLFLRGSLGIFLSVSLSPMRKRRKCPPKPVLAEASRGGGSCVNYLESVEHLLA